MAGENATFSAAGYGTAQAKVEYVGFGIEIVAGTSDEGRNSRAFYLERKTAQPFQVGLIFSSYASYGLFGLWLANYITRIQDPSQAFSPMRVVIPSRQFDRLGIPSSGITAGDHFDAITYRMPVGFVEMSDLNNGNVSRFVPPNLTGNPEAAYYYPSNVVLGGNQAGNDILADQGLYDIPPDPTVSTDSMVPAVPIDRRQVQ